jgi:hypothetical protein
MAASSSLSVKVWTSPEESEMGKIRFEQNEVIIQLESGRVISSKDSGDIYYEMMETVALKDNGASAIESIGTRVTVLLEPFQIVHHQYTSLGGQVVEDIFPPSTAGFYGRLLGGKHDAVYFIQRVKNSEQFWLTIRDSNTPRIFEALLIKPYEAEALSLIEDTRIALSSMTKDATREEALAILDAPSPTWEDLSKILEDVSIPNLKIGRTVRNTFDQIVPTSFPDEIREELMAFLGFVVQSKIPDDDPLTYLSRFSSTTVLEFLVTGHLMHLIDKTEWPSYVKLMVLAARGQLEAPTRTLSDTALSSPWHVYIQKCVELVPNWLPIALNSAKTLNESGKIVLGLPTTSSAAKRSRTSWKKRFAEMSHSLRARGFVNPASLGLVELVYLGAAYRWPHKHMKFITRLGSASGNPPHLQVMLMPHNAAERVRRTLPSVLSIAWSARTLNLELFDENSGTWVVPLQRIIDSIDKRSSIRKLRNRFGDGRISDAYQMTTNDARVADLISSGIDLSFLELPEYINNLGMKKTQIRSHLSNLINRKVMHLTYEVMNPKLVSLAIIMQGKQETIASLTYDLLRNTPTSDAKVSESGEDCVVLCRLPEESVQSIATQLTARGMDQGLNIRCMRPTTFRSYASNLYQRLLRNDGSWDDDVNAFLSQARSKRRELSESNA